MGKRGARNDAAPGLRPGGGHGGTSRVHGIWCNARPRLQDFGEKPPAACERSGITPWPDFTQSGTRTQPEAGERGPRRIGAAPPYQSKPRAASSRRNARRSHNVNRPFSQQSASCPPSGENARSGT